MAAELRQRSYRAWRAVCALPTVLGSVLVFTVAFGWLGNWFGLALLGWAAVAVALWLRPGERIGVHVAYGYRRPTAAQWAALSPVAREALQGCAIPESAIDLYVRPRVTSVNGFAAGRHAVAVSQGVLLALDDGRLSVGHAAALLTHEFGHTQTGGARYALILDWLSLPWRLAAGAVMGVIHAIVRHVPTARAALVLAPLIGVVAAAQAVQHHAWLVLSVLVGLFLVAVVQPVLEAATSRASERAADRFTAACGGGPDLAQVLHTFPSQHHAGRWRASHPDPARRVADLTAAAQR